MDTAEDMLIDLTFCILGKLYELFEDNKIDYDAFIDHAKVKIKFLNDMINPAY